MEAYLPALCRMPGGQPNGSQVLLELGLQGRVLKVGSRRVKTSSDKALEYGRVGEFFMYLESALV